MKLARVRLDGAVIFGIVDGDQITPIDGAPFDRDEIAPVGDPIPLDQVTVLAPVEPTKVLAIGRNYAAHAAEMGTEVGSVPSVFMKPPNSIIAHQEAVVLPPTHLSNRVEHEAELVIVIGRTARNVRRDAAGDVILGYTCGDDVTARDIQKSDPQITRGKGFDTFCPLGPFIETDLDLDAGVDIECRVNGELRQHGNTRDLIFDVPTLIEHLTEWTTLLPGDIILTGSPAGTGTIHDGDEVEIAIQGVGTLVHHVTT